MYESELKFAKDVALEAGEIMSRYFDSEDLGTVHKDDHSPLTVADTEVNQMVLDRIEESYPTYSLVGEEQSLMKEGSEFTWVCDPIDGTTPYSIGMPVSTFVLALVDSDGQPVLCVVRDPFMKKTYYAVKGGGAFCEDEKLSVSDEKISEKSLFLGYREMYAGSESLPVEIKAPLSLWSSVYMALQVVKGYAVASTEGGGKAWDGVAIKLLVEEAGGRVTTYSGEERRYDEAGEAILATNGVVHDEILEQLKKG